MSEEKKDITGAFVEVLNRALETDREAIQWLFEYRVQCNNGLLKDPTIQVRARDDRVPTLGVLGLINGLLGEIGSGLICTVVESENNGHIIKFGRLDECSSKSK